MNNSQTSSNGIDSLFEHILRNFNRAIIYWTLNKIRIEKIWDFELKIVNKEFLYTFLYWMNLSII